MTAEMWKPYIGQVADGKYRLKSLAGVGGFGAVFLADHVVAGRVLREVAVKLIVPDEESAEAQMRELGGAIGFKHSHLLECYDAGLWRLETHSLLYLVMEVAEGQLSQVLKNGPLPPAEVVLLVESVASALAYLHGLPERVVHQDLKPDNVMRAGGRWKVSDFGTVRPVGTKTSLQTGRLPGTLYYMPPESFDGVISPTWDSWSLGVLIVRALTGRLPFEGNTEPAVIQAIVAREPRIEGPLAAPFDEIVRGCFRKDRKTRWTIEQVLARLRAVSPPVTEVRQKRLTPLWLGAAAAVLVVAGVIGLARFGGDASPKTTQPTETGAKPPAPQAKEPAKTAALAPAPSRPPVVEPVREPVRAEARVNPKDGLPYVWIAPGSFQMGCSPGDSECEGVEKPAHAVTITKGFWMGQTEVTVAAYKRFSVATKRSMPSASRFNADWAATDGPMVYVSWDEARTYCEWTGGRLPREAEWEYAARAGTTGARYGDVDDIGWYSGNSGNRAHTVGGKKPNAFGLYDMLGNAGSGRLIGTATTIQSPRSAIRADLPWVRTV